MPTSSPCYRSLCGWTVDFLCHRRPIPWQQFVEAVDLVVMDAVENVGQIGLRIEAVDLCGLDDRHGASQGFGPGISTGEEPIFPADANWAQCPLGGIVVDGDTTVGQEQAEGLRTY